MTGLLLLTHDRPDIVLETGTLYGELHCGDCFQLYKNALPPGRASSLYNYAAKALYNTDSVVYYDSTFSQKEQENNRFAQILVSENTDAYSIIAERETG